MTVNEEIKRYVRDRNAALLSFDVEKIKAFYLKYKKIIGFYRLPDDEILFAAAMKQVLVISSASGKEKKRAKEWLKIHGYKFDMR